MNVRTKLLALLLCFVPLASHAWFNGDFAYRKKITFNTTPAGLELKSDLAPVPVLLRLHTGNFSFLDAKEDGADLRIVASDDKTPLKFHIEQWDSANQLGLVWVLVPKLTANSAAEFVYLYYGNEKVGPGSEPKATYDPAQLAVLHFADKSNAAKDDGPYQFPAVATGVTPGAAGVDGLGAGFAGAGKIVVAAAPALKVTAASGATVSLWAKPAAGSGNATLFELSDGARSLSIGIEGDRLYAQANGAKATAAAAVTVAAWHHVAATWKDKLVLYVDGAEAGSAQLPAIDLAGAATIGDAAAGNAAFKGEIDELQIASAARSGEFVKFMAINQGPAESRLMTFGQDEQGAGSGSSYFAILLHSVTLDGWVVIGILVVMAVISFWVMGSKAVFLARTQKGNDAFQAQFAQLSSDVLKLHASARGGPSALFQQSSLYRIYSVGVSELMHRFEAYDKKGQPRTLTPQALDAIKASLDAGYVRESHRLNRLLVLLTIAISGGPFLGLLGTVVGVMITFAAIAAAGDVNVNAIAPGIAAALVATVAGLGVAIPSLFGYNYLASRIKNMTADMQVFNDEFITKLAEQYS